ncbi:hypothetical protein ACH4SP_11700 [Streptomyces sp. NPDC021093]|uniref:hypothetical protein n=1 Tax=Streptomyces sp. NPDC021093 TaxID=3365112 RepID=UPI00378795F1
MAAAVLDQVAEGAGEVAGPGDVGAGQSDREEVVDARLSPLTDLDEPLSLGAPNTATT